VGRSIGINMALGVRGSGTKSGEVEKLQGRYETSKIAREMKIPQSTLYKYYHICKMRSVSSMSRGE
jgi:hypothetical protein